MSISCASKWCVVHTHPGAEAKAAEHLRRQGFATYLPRFRRTRRHARRVDTVAAPLFPRYLFVAVDVERQRWRCIQSTTGVTRLVCNGEMPACVDDGVVAELREREDAQGYVKLSPHLAWRPGAKIRMQTGPLFDCIGRFDGLADAERVNVLLDLLGRKVRVVVDAGWVTAA